MDLHQRRRRHLGLHVSPLRRSKGGRSKYRDLSLHGGQQTNMGPNRPHLTHEHLKRHPP
jgi:hypothetical protein